jgi:hypothetical protein
MALFHIEAQDATKRVLEILAVVFVLFVAAYIGVDQYYQVLPQKQDGITSRGPEVTFYDAEIVGRSSGVIQWKVKADILEQNSLYITLDRISECVFQDNDEVFMQVIAPKGRIGRATQDVEFEGPVDVRLWIEVEG